LIRAGWPRSSFNFEFDKRITENFGIGINWGWNLNQVTNGKTAGCFQNLFFTGKYQTYRRHD
jgi:hypothetical protein